MRRLFYRIPVFVVSILALFKWLVLRPKVLLYSPDVVSTPEGYDVRIRHLYDFLNKHNIRWGEILHTVPSMRFFRNLAKRKRLAWYLEAPGLALALRLARPKHIWIIDDMRYWDKMIVPARKLGIRLHAFQHGRYYGGMPVTSDYPMCLWVWSEYWKERFLQLHPRAHVAVGGRAQAKRLVIAPATADNIITVLVPYEASTRHEEVRPYLAALQKGGIEILLKIRQDEEEAIQLERYGVTTSVRELTPEVLQRIDVVLGTYSTMLYEMAALARPVGILKTSSTQAEELGPLISSPQEVVEAVKKLAATPFAELQQRADSMQSPDLDTCLSSLLSQLD